MNGRSTTTHPNPSAASRAPGRMRFDSSVVEKISLLDTGILQRPQYRRFTAPRPYALFLMGPGIRAAAIHAQFLVQSLAFAGTVLAFARSG